MASGMDMMLAQVMPLLRKMIPDEVWEQVTNSFKKMSEKVTKVDERLARIEESQLTLRRDLFAMMQLKDASAGTENLHDFRKEGTPSQGTPNGHLILPSENDGLPRGGLDGHTDWER